VKMRQTTFSRSRYRKTQLLADTILDIVNREFVELSMSTRQLFYQCVSRGAVPNSNASYDRVQRLVVDLRREGAIEYDRIVDRTRIKHRVSQWEGPIQIMEAVGKQYRRDLWSEQDNVVMVACEKQALEGIFAEVVDRYGASLWTLHGYGSESFLYEWANEIRKYYDDGKGVLVAYFGDFDPTGLDIERHAQKSLEGHLGVTVDWTRRGLTEEDFEAFELVNVAVKSSDSRARAYLEKYGNKAAELDALPPDELRLRIESVIEEYIDSDAWDRLADVETVERESINVVVKNWDVALEAARGAV
jgi:hypothetical protein